LGVAVAVATYVRTATDEVIDTLDWISPAVLLLTVLVLISLLRKRKR